MTGYDRWKTNAPEPLSDHAPCLCGHQLQDHTPTAGQLCVLCDCEGFDLDEEAA